MVCLIPMTQERMHAFYRAFVYDPAIGKNNMQEYIYDPDRVDRIIKKHRQQGKLHYAIMLDEQVIGDIYLKHINTIEHSCEIGIHMVNDQYKGKGFGCAAIRLMTQKAFTEMEMECVWAVVLDNNKRSIKAFQKAGFSCVSQSDGYSRLVSQKPRENASNNTIA